LILVFSSRLRVSVVKYISYSRPPRPASVTHHSNLIPRLQVLESLPFGKWNEMNWIRPYGAYQSLQVCWWRTPTKAKIARQFLAFR